VKQVTTQKGEYGGGARGLKVEKLECKGPVRNGERFTRLKRSKLVDEGVAAPLGTRKLSPDVEEEGRCSSRGEGNPESQSYGGRYLEGKDQKTVWEETRRGERVAAGEDVSSGQNRGSQRVHLGKKNQP